MPEWRDLWYPKRWLGCINLSLRRRFRFPPAYARQVVNEILAQDADLVVFSGDMTTASLHTEFAGAADLFKPLHDKWGDRFFIIPGNHDRYTPITVGDLRYERYFPYGAMPESGIKVRTFDPDDEWRIIGFDCSKPYMLRSNGIMTKPLLQQLEKALRQAHADDRMVILVGHFPYATPPEHAESWEHKLLGAEALRLLIAQYKPSVYLHGHKHIRWLIHPESTPETTCINSGSAGLKSSNLSKQAGFATIEVDPEKGVTACHAYTLPHDTEAWKSYPLYSI